MKGIAEALVGSQRCGTVTLWTEQPPEQQVELLNKQRVNTVLPTMTNQKQVLPASIYGGDQSAPTQPLSNKINACEFECSPCKETEQGQQGQGTESTMPMISSFSCNSNSCDDPWWPHRNQQDTTLVPCQDEIQLSPPPPPIPASAQPWTPASHHVLILSSGAKHHIITWQAWQAAWESPRLHRTRGLRDARPGFQAPW